MWPPTGLVLGHAYFILESGSWVSCAVRGYRPLYCFKGIIEPFVCAALDVYVLGFTYLFSHIETYCLSRLLLNSDRSSLNYL